jgi:hypothetical protein
MERRSPKHARGLQERGMKHREREGGWMMMIANNSFKHATFKIDKV